MKVGGEIHSEVAMDGVKKELEKIAIIPPALFTMATQAIKEMEPTLKRKMFEYKVKKRTAEIMKVHPRMYPENAAMIALFEVAERESIRVRKGQAVF